MSGDDMEPSAASWLAREDRGLTADERAALTQWLEQSTLHRVAYLRLKASWRRADRLAALRRPERPAKRGDGARLPGLRFSTIAAALLLGLLCGGTYLAYRWSQGAAQQTYATDIGRTQAVRLEDGTRMELNTDTRVHAQVTQTERTVTLDAGEAYFEVVHDARRPFIVYAGNRRITDLGTKFSVYRDGDDVQVTVKEGRVRVDILNKPAVAAPVEATGGNVVFARTEETLLMARPAEQIANDLSWRSGMLVFNQQTLAEAAEQFNRYNAKKILVEGDARKIRIGGTFKADNVSGFVYLIRHGFGVSVSDRGNTIVVSQ